MTSATTKGGNMMKTQPPSRNPNDSLNPFQLPSFTHKLAVPIEFCSTHNHHVTKNIVGVCFNEKEERSVAAKTELRLGVNAQAFAGLGLGKKRRREL